MVDGVDLKWLENWPLLERIVEGDNVDLDVIW